MSAADDDLWIRPIIPCLPVHAAAVQVPADAVSPGDLLTVLPGDRVPVDGVVVGGRSAVDESALSGEPLPLTKTSGGRGRGGRGLDASDEVPSLPGPGARAHPSQTTALKTRMLSDLHARTCAARLCGFMPPSKQRPGLLGARYHS